MNNKFTLLAFLLFLTACVQNNNSNIDNEEKVFVAKSDKQYVFMEYSWSHRPGTGMNGFGESLTAFEGWVMVPNEANDGIYNVKHSYAEQFSRKECENQLVEKLKEGQFESSEDCSDSQSTCFTINNNIVNGTGYLNQKYFFHCIPYEFWNSLKSQSEEKCYGPTDADGWSEEEPCLDYILELNRDIYKSPSEYKNVIKECKDYKEDSLFVCEDTGS